MHVPVIDFVLVPIKGFCSFKRNPYKTVQYEWQMHAKTPYSKQLATRLIVSLPRMHVPVYAVTNDFMYLNGVKNQNMSHVVLTV